MNGDTLHNTANLDVVIGIVACFILAWVAFAIGGFVWLVVKYAPLRLEPLSVSLGRHHGVEGAVSVREDPQSPGPGPSDSTTRRSS